MAYEIIGETIKSATSIKLGEIFNNPKRYKENVTKPTYPAFFIIQVNLNTNYTNADNLSILDNPKNRIRLNYLMNIQYRVAENTEGLTNLQKQLDEVGLKLMTEFNELDLELPVKVLNKQYEKVDGVGQFTYNVNVYATPEIIATIKMKKLELNKNI